MHEVEKNVDRLLNKISAWCSAHKSASLSDDFLAGNLPKTYLDEFEELRPEYEAMKQSMRKFNTFTESLERLDSPCGKIQGIKGPSTDLTAGKKTLTEIHGTCNALLDEAETWKKVLGTWAPERQKRY